MQDIDIVLLAKIINIHYSLSQIKQLCFELGVEFDDLDGIGKMDKARELVLEMKRQVRLPELMKKVSMDRPNVAKSLHSKSFRPQIQIHFNRFIRYRWLLLTILISISIVLFIIYKIVIGNGQEINVITSELNMISVADSPCPKLYFLSELSELSLKNRQILDNCAIQMDLVNSESILRIRGSSAWPLKYPVLTKDDVLKIADERALIVAKYLETRGVDPKLVIIEPVMPPEDHWETNDLKILEKDRFVEFVLEPIAKNGR